MRISTITNWAYATTLVLTGLSAAAFLASASAANAERAAIEERLTFDTLAEDLEDAAEKLSDDARLFAMTRDNRHLDAFRYEMNVTRSRDRALEGVHALDATDDELAAVGEAERNLSDLDRLDLAGVAAIQRGDQNAGERFLYGADHERAQTVVATSLAHFRALTAARTSLRVRETQVETDRASAFAKIMLALTAGVFLSVLYFVLRQRVALPLRRMTGIVMRLAKQDYEVEVPRPQRRDEIGEITQAIQVFRDNGVTRERLEAERRAEQRIKDLILQMIHRLQACQTLEELTEVVVCFAPQTFPNLAGRLYIYEPDRNAMALAGSWLSPQHSSASFPPTACWGVRRGHTHRSEGSGVDVACGHVNVADAKTLCAPLSAQGETIGLLYFEQREDEVAPVEAPAGAYLELMSENTALALANLRLRTRLADLAARDGLTGLMNRRTLDAALAAYASSEAKLACVMIDIDHFKTFNDQFGHDAGDAVIQHVAQITQDIAGVDGAAYRFGGEELTLLLPETNAAAALETAERLRERVAAAPLAHHGRLLGHITISLGVAAFPGDGPPATLLKRADAALLEAKAHGRNRTVLAAHASGRDGERAA